MFTAIVFEIMLSEGRLVLSPAQCGVQRVNRLILKLNFKI